MTGQKFTDTFVSREHLFSIGTEEASGKHYVSIPVSNGMVDYEAYYEIDGATFAQFSNDVEAALVFAGRCRGHEMDDLLIVKPGRIRGNPI
jgi:hypothetical protein